MKTHQTPRILRGLTALVGGFALFTGALQAAPFLYAPGDLVLTFRKDGNASDYVVNIGKATNYSSLPVGTSFVVANLALAQLNAAFPDLNDLAWSVAAANRPPLVPGFPQQTLWVTAPRLDANVQSPAWLRKGSFAQGTPASQIDGVGVAGAASSSSQSAGPNNTATGVVIPVNTDFTISPLLGTGRNYVNTFQGVVETLTAADFDSDNNNVSRADLYELLPGTVAAGTLNTPGRHLGYFELKPGGVLTFSTSAAPPAASNITAIHRANDVATVSFTTASPASYRLRATSTLGTPVASWPVVSGPVIGTGAILSLQETNAAPSRFFAVEVQP